MTINKYSIQDMYILASEKEGFCLSNEYKNAHIKLTWKCNKNHVWDSTPNSIRRGSWCPECSGNKTKSINEMIILASNRDGKCISTTYIGVKTKLEWECKEGHHFFLTPDNVIQGQWCKKCSRKKVSDSKRGNISTMNSYAIKNGGKCLSTEYFNVKTKLEWECKEGHLFKLTPNDVQQGSWCLLCSRKNSALKKMDTIENMKKLAENKGGKCLSEIYLGNKSSLLWECTEKHQWETTPASIKTGSWCPRCADLFYIGERICHLYFESIFKTKFKKSRPKWFRNKNNNIMELDGYSDDLKIAFEYQGIQHYKVDGFINKNESDLNKRIENDLYKYELCKKLGINLFIIDYKLEHENIPNEIKKQSIEINLDISNIDFNVKVDFNSLNLPTKIKEMNEIATEKGGKCISSVYINAKEYLLWECKEGHKWKASPNNIKNNGRWCPKCAGKLKSIIDMEILAKEKLGKCLSEKYINAKTKLKWKCSEGHIWESIPDSIIRGSWCPICCRKNKK